LTILANPPRLVAREPSHRHDGGNPARTTCVFAALRHRPALVARHSKDSDKRQRAAIDAFAKRAGFAVIAEFSDPGVSGADPIETRPGFSSLLDRIEANGVRTVIVEDASRFARELVTQELGIIALIKRRVRVLTANGDDLTDSSDPSRKMMRQIAGSFAEYEKARLVAKLKAARERKWATSPHPQMRGPQELGRDQSRAGAGGETVTPPLAEGASTVTAGGCRRTGQAWLHERAWRDVLSGVGAIDPGLMRPAARPASRMRPGQ
jgi:hypothetical protein